MAKVICTHCGAANPEESAFCEQCGAALEKQQSAEQQAVRYQEAQPAKKSGGKKWIIPVVILLVLALAGGGIYMYQKHQAAEEARIAAEKAKAAKEKAEAEKTIPIDLASIMTTPQITGEDGKGIVSTEPVVDGNKSTVILNSINEKKKEDMGKFLNSVKYKASPNEGLSNGDKVKIQIDYDKELAAKLNLEISGTSAEVKVKGLTEPAQTYTESYSDDEVPGDVFPWSSDAYVEESEAEALTDYELRIAINEIYARHGFTFGKADLKKHFEAQDWYTPTTDDVPDSELNEYEYANVQVLKDERQARKDAGTWPYSK